MASKKRLRLIYWRRRTRLSQEAAAAALGCHRQTVVKLEHGKMPIDDNWLSRLSALYGCQAWELLEDAPLMSREERQILEMAQGLDEDRRELVLRFVAELARPREAG